MGRTRTRAFERTYRLAASRASSSKSPRFAGQPPLQHQRATSSCEITPFSMQFLRRFHCRFYARHPWRGAYSTTGSPNFPDSGTQFPRGADPETASHSEAEIWDALSAKGRKGKAHPIPSINSGARFVIPAHTSRQTKSAWCLPYSLQPPSTPALSRAAALFCYEHMYVIAAYNIASYNVERLHPESALRFRRTTTAANSLSISHAFKHAIQRRKIADRMLFFEKVRVPKLTRAS